MTKVLMLAAVLTAAVGPVRAEETPAMEWPSIHAVARRTESAIARQRVLAARTVAQAKVGAEPESVTVEQVIELSRRMTYLGALMVLEDYARQRRARLSPRDLTLLLEEVARTPLKQHGYRDIEYQTKVIEAAAMDWTRVSYGELMPMLSAMVSVHQRDMVTEAWLAARRRQ